MSHLFRNPPAEIAGYDVAMRAGYVEETGSQFRFLRPMAPELGNYRREELGLSRTTPCVACGHLVSYTAKSCPSCGHGLPTTTWWERGAILTGALVIIFSPTVTQELLSAATVIGAGLIGVAVITMNRRAARGSRPRGRR